MMSNAFIIGFFTAMGWFSAQKIVSMASEPVKPVAVVEKKE